VSIDITGPHPRSSAQHQYILTLVDHFSKWAEAIPIHNHTAPTVARALITNIFSRYGAPGEILSDLGPEFQSTLFSELLSWMEIHRLRTTPYKPSTNGTVERFHRTLNSMLGKVIKESQRDWHERLPLVMAAYRSTVHKATGFSPNRLFLGRETRMPLDLVMGLPASECERGQTTDEYVQNVQNQLEACYETARKHLRAAAERRKATYDLNVKKTDLSVGDWVWYHYPRRYKSRSPKWQKHYTGPYLITRMIEPVNCVLQKSQRAKAFVVHIDKIKKCYDNTPVSWLSEPLQSDETTYVKVRADANTPAEHVADMPLRDSTHQVNPAESVEVTVRVNDCSDESIGRRADVGVCGSLPTMTDDAQAGSGAHVGAAQGCRASRSSGDTTVAVHNNGDDSTNTSRIVSGQGPVDGGCVNMDDCNTGPNLTQQTCNQNGHNPSSTTYNDTSQNQFNKTDAYQRAKRDHRIPARFADFVMK